MLLATVKRAITYTIAFLLFALNASAQSKHTSTIEGRVINKQGEPERGVKVKVTNHGCFKTSTTTDTYGGYKLSLEPGKYTVTVLHKTEAESNKDIELSKNEKAKLDISESNTAKKQFEVFEDDVR